MKIIAVIKTRHTLILGSAGTKLTWTERLTAWLRGTKPEWRLSEDRVRVARQHVLVEPGEYELVRMPAPNGFRYEDWFVLRSANVILKRRKTPKSPVVPPVEETVPAEESNLLDSFKAEFKKPDYDETTIAVTQDDMVGMPISCWKKWCIVTGVEGIELRYEK
jgi:hypothetical protein